MTPVLKAQALLAACFDPVTHSYTQRDTMLYALGVGVGLGEGAATDPAHLRHVYEGSPGGLVALPTMTTVLATQRLMQLDGYGIDWPRVVHGEQSLRMHRPLPSAGTVQGQERVSAIFDKGAEKGAVMVIERELRAVDATGAHGELIATLKIAAMLRGNGGFGGSSEGAPQPRPVPADRPADLWLDLPTRPEQALLYRLNADDNPLHADPDAASAAGFDRPILHGLCSYGIAARALCQLLCDGDVSRFVQLDLRFVRPVMPGDTLRTEVWRLGQEQAACRVRVVESDAVVLDHGRFEFATGA